MSSPSETPQVSIILPTIRTGSVSAAIEAVLAQTVQDWELVVVPQGDDKKLISLLEDYQRRDPRVRYVHTDRKNLSHARNVGMEAARGSIFAFTDDDCEVAPDYVATMIDFFKRRPDIGYLGGEVVAQPNPTWWRISTCPAAHVIEGEFHPSREANAPPGFYMIGANMAVRREVAEKVGKFDTVLGAGAQFACCEDQDFEFRAGTLGTSLATTPRLVVYHSTGRRFGLKDFLKHQHNYARGRGAWVAKLVMAGDPVGIRWSQPPRLRDQLALLVRKPHKWLLEQWARPIAKQAAAEYVEQYELDAAVLSTPKKGRAPISK